MKLPLDVQPLVALEIDVLLASPPRLGLPLSFLDWPISEYLTSADDMAWYTVH